MNGKYELEDQPRFGRPLVVDDRRLKEAIEAGPRQISRCLAEEFAVDHKTILRYLHVLGYMWRYSAWIPHALEPHQLRQRSDTCMYLLTSHYGSNWLDCLATGDEK